jgi:hypothetical protein
MSLTDVDSRNNITKVICNVTKYYKMKGPFSCSLKEDAYQVRSSTLAIKFKASQ